MSSSYAETPLFFRIRKVLRYLQIYGPSRTWVKVRGQLHMAKEVGFNGDRWVNPNCWRQEAKERFVAIIGCGNFAYSEIAFDIHRAAPRALRATYDPHLGRARSLCAAYGGAYAAADPQTIIDDPNVRLVYIASDHASHAEYAIRCIEAGKHVHIEKPQVVRQEQLDRLTAACRARPEIMVFLGFNRPKSRHFELIRRTLEAQSGPIMINWFIAGHEIADDHWYFAPEQGGRVLGNLCHWSDLTLQMVGLDNALPITVIPASPNDTKSDFCVGLQFGDRSLACITFSAKGHTFEGVREVLQAHRGDALILMRDFGECLIDVREHKIRLRPLFRDHGHRKNVVNSLLAVRDDNASRAVPLIYNRATALLFLKIKQAIDTGETLTLDAF